MKSTASHAPADTLVPEQEVRLKKTTTNTSRFGLAMVALYVVALLGFGIGPTLYAMYLSMVSDDTGQFLGFWQWGQVFADYRLGTSVMNITKFIAIWIPLMFAMTLLISLMLQVRPSRFSNAMKLVYYLPGAFTGAASALLWVFIVNPSAGPFGAVLRFFGFEFANELVTTPTLPILFALMAFTSGLGGWVVIMYGALNSIGTEVLESAAMDGANKWQLATRIQIPLMKKYIVYMGIITVTSGLQLYAEPQLINPFFGVGSTATTPSSTWSINQLILTLGIQEGKVGQASALSLIVLLVALVAGAILIFRTDFFDTKEIGK